MDAPVDLNLRWAHSHFVGFVMRRLIFDRHVQGPLLKLLNLLKRFSFLSDKYEEHLDDGDFGDLDLDFAE